MISYRGRTTAEKTQARRQGLIVGSVVLGIKTVEAEKSSYTDEVDDGGFPTVYAAGSVAVCKYSKRECARGNESARKKTKTRTATIHDWGSSGGLGFERNSW